jgi:hypothetical protein
MLHLPHLKTMDMKENVDDYRFLVETISSPPSYCPKCGTTANLYSIVITTIIFRSTNVSVSMSNASGTNVRNVMKRFLTDFESYKYGLKTSHYPITNAYTESLNRLNNLRRGYSFEALRTKIFVYSRLS